MNLQHPQELEKKVRWNKWGQKFSREQHYGKFPNQMQDLFPWTPELKEN